MTQLAKQKTIVCCTQTHDHSTRGGADGGMTLAGYQMTSACIQHALSTLGCIMMDVYVCVGLECIEY